MAAILARGRRVNWANLLCLYCVPLTYVQYHDHISEDIEVGQQDKDAIVIVRRTRRYHTDSKDPWIDVD